MYVAVSIKINQTIKQVQKNILIILELVYKLKKKKKKKSAKAIFENSEVF